MVRLFRHRPVTPFTVTLYLGESLAPPLKSMCGVLRPILDMHTLPMPLKVPVVGVPLPALGTMLHELLAELWCKVGSGTVHNVQITVLNELENGAYGRVGSVCSVLLKLTVILDHMFLEVCPPVKAVIATRTRGHPILAMLLPVKHNKLLLGCLHARATVQLRHVTP